MSTKVKNIGKKKGIQKVAATIIMLVIFVSSFVPFAFAASNQKSRYTTTLSFDTTCTGATRHYNGHNISISLHTFTSNIDVNKFNNSNLSKNYYVYLYRKGWLWCTDKVGYAKLTINKQGTVKWSNVGEGDYYFYFSKTHDGINIKSDNVVMQNY